MCEGETHAKTRCSGDCVATQTGCFRGSDGTFSLPSTRFGSPSGLQASVIVHHQPYRVPLRGFVGGVRYHRFRRVELRRRFVATVAAECPVVTPPPERRGNRSMSP